VEIANSFGYPYETFRKKFKEYTGVSPLQFRLQAKFNLAQRLLTDGHSISEVAEETGYADSFIFSRQFKKYTGKNPKDFKTKPK
jgi:AraC-like DNA-binding protein